MRATTQQAPLAGPILQGGADAVRARLAAFVGWVQAEISAWRTERQLRELSDHMLRDVGLRRDEIESISREAGRR